MLKDEVMAKENKSVMLTKDCSVEHVIGFNDDPEVFLHDGIEIYLCISGGDKFIISDKVYEINPMDLFIIGSYDIHKEIFKKNVLYERYYALFSIEFLSRFSTLKTDLKRCFVDFLKQGYNKIRLSQEQSEELTKLFKKSLNINSSVGKDLHEKIYLLEIILYASQICHNNKGPVLMDYYSKDNAPVIERLFDYINKNISKDLTLDHLAQEVHLNKSYMCKVFKNIQEQL